MNRWAPDSWYVSAVYDSREQAEQAARVIIATAPREYQFDARTIAGEIIWRESGETHGAHDVRL